jgi:hypothetical protein
MCLVPMARLMASSMRLYNVRRWVSLANQVYIQVQQQARATSKITGSARLNEEMEQRRRSRGPPSHSLQLCLVCTHSKGTYYHLLREVVSSAPVPQFASLLPRTIPLYPALPNSGSFPLPPIAVYASVPFLTRFAASASAFHMRQMSAPSMCGSVLLPHHRDLRATAGVCCRLRRSPRQMPSPA